MSLKDRYLSAKRAVLEREFSRMNPMQKQAVFHTEGPVLILAGAGSGKTTVLVNRVANIIRYGNAYEASDMPEEISEEDVSFLEQCSRGGEIDRERVASLIAVSPCKPWQILAITFTNKAAGELKERLELMLGDSGEGIWASTFHASCARMLRRDADRIGYSSRFTVYDTDDQKRLVKEIMNSLKIDDKLMPHKSIIAEISRAKESLLEPEAFAARAGSDFRLKKVSEVYTLYQRRLKDADAMDFDDLLANTVRLLEQNEDILEHYRRRFRYIMIDEYQDTNHAQYVFVKLLAGGNGNLCVVGDDDQSIYKFRGATIENILSFEQQYPSSMVIRLEQNYRSTQNILDAANAVIGNNTERKEKSLWSERGSGEPIEVYTAFSDRDEARYIAEVITDSVAGGSKYSDHAILYRTNAQSNSIEYFLSRANIPYRVIGGHRFYERKEIKDMLAYLAVITNPSDEIRLRRIINEPKRGIGDKSVDNAAEIASQLSISLFEVMRTADQYQVLSRSAQKMREFTDMIEALMDEAEDVNIPLCDLLDSIMTKTGYLDMLKSDEKGQDRAENINELKSNLVKYQEEHGEDTDLGEFLEEVALVADIDNYDNESDTVVLMTLHSAKGLEFPVVFLPGMEEGLFPGRQTMLYPDEIEEERRLAYVGITRAKDKLYIIHAESRMLYGSTVRNKLSRFACEIPETLIEKKRTQPMQQAKRPDIGKPFHEAKMADYESSKVLSGAAAKSSDSEKLSVGDRVKHKIFGEGTIVSAKAVGSDMLLEVSFDKVGTKKLMSNFAPLTKI